jgi:type III pantothenate kinase
MKECWLALAIGNSRSHWALFTGQQLLKVLHLPLSEFKGFLERSPQHGTEWRSFFPTGLIELENSVSSQYPELWLVSVVPTRAKVWASYPRLNALQLSDIPLREVYPGLGVDRAISLWGAGVTYGWPCLVIDGGTAITITGADDEACLVGGSILPGLALQFHSLASSTAALPLAKFPDRLPGLWERETATAIQSGILNTVVAGLNHAILQWLKRYPDSKIVMTGGDAELLAICLQEWTEREGRASSLDVSRVITDRNLLFWGVNALRERVLSQRFDGST